MYWSIRKIRKLVSPKYYCMNSCSTDVLKSDFTANKLDGRPWHQKALEVALNNGDQKRINQILDSIPIDDPYKRTMEMYRK